MNAIPYALKNFLKPKKLSFALPITLNENIGNLKWRRNSSCNVERRFVVLIKTFLKYFDINDLGKFLIICPARDINKLELLLRDLTHDNRFIVIDEKTICPDLDDLPQGLAGWYIQQILKISVAKFINTNFYLTLDSDVICKRHFNTAMLIPSGKAYTNIETKSDYDEIYNGHFSDLEWEVKNRRLTTSAKILNYQRTEPHINNSYGETPVLLHTKSVNKMIGALSTQYGNWVKALSNKKGWTEYTLYFLYMEKHNILHKYHISTNRNTILDLEASVWQTPEKYKYDKVFSPASILEQRVQHGYFVVIQSYLNADKWLPKDFQSTDEFYAAINALNGIRLD